MSHPSLYQSPEWEILGVVERAKRGLPIFILNDRVVLLLLDNLLVCKILSELGPKRAMVFSEKRCNFVLRL